MAIKYISIVLGTIFEIYCINMFTNIYLPRKEIEKYKYYLIFILNDKSFPVISIGRRKTIPKEQLKVWINSNCKR